MRAIATNARHEEAPGEDRGFVAEEEYKARDTSDALVDALTLGRTGS
jgi:hypothetical protein